MECSSRNTSVTVVACDHIPHIQKFNISTIILHNITIFINYFILALLGNDSIDIFNAELCRHFLFQCKQKKCTRLWQKVNILNIIYWYWERNVGLCGTSSRVDLLWQHEIPSTASVMIQISTSKTVLKICAEVVSACTEVLMAFSFLVYIYIYIYIYIYSNTHVQCLQVRRKISVWKRYLRA